MAVLAFLSRSRRESAKKTHACRQTRTLPPGRFAARSGQHGAAGMFMHRKRSAYIRHATARRPRVRDDATCMCRGIKSARRRAVLHRAARDSAALPGAPTTAGGAFDRETGRARGRRPSVGHFPRTSSSMPRVNVEGLYRRAGNLIAFGTLRECYE